jgi:hypothetical protein
MKWMNKTSNVFIWGHEETHLLKNTGNIIYLEKELQNKQNISIDLTSIQDVEVLADIGGLYAVLRSKLNPYNIDCKFRYSAALEIMYVGRTKNLLANS